MNRRKPSTSTHVRNRSEGVRVSPERGWVQPKIPIVFTILLFGAAVACGEPSGETEETESAVTGTLTDRSLVVTDPEILARFGFGRTMNTLRNTAVASGQTLDPSETNPAIFKRWMRSFGRGPDGCDRPGMDPDGFGLVCPREAEAKLANVSPFGEAPAVEFIPVGLFNRFDLMPANGVTCGEHRIVYAMQSSVLAGRAFIIFEAALPNPDPASGIEGCLPVAKFWQSLTNDNDIASRAKKLVDFYFDGTAIPGFGPVITAANFGLLRADGSLALAGRRGQIRTNFFIDFAEWHLREFKLQTVCPTPSTCQLRFNHVRVKSNPAEELFAGTHTLSAEFRSNFIDQVAGLASPELRLANANRFNEFESVSQASNAQYALVADATIRSAIRSELTRLGASLTPKNILDRATSQTCAGCHQLSSGADLGGGLTFPSSLVFVHIDEERNLSPALKDVFLPARLEQLERFITVREAPRPQTLDAPVN